MMYTRTVSFFATVLSLITLYSIAKTLPSYSNHAEKAIVKEKMDSDKPQQTVYSSLFALGATGKIKLSEKPKRRWRTKIQHEWPRDRSISVNGSKEMSKEKVFEKLERIYNSNIKTGMPLQVTLFRYFISHKEVKTYTLMLQR